MVLQKSTVNGATQQRWNRKEKKSHLVFSFLSFKFLSVLAL